MRNVFALLLLAIFLSSPAFAEQTDADQFGLPPGKKGDVQIFYPESSTGSWQKWEKPRGCTMVYAIAIGGGGGGGGGFTRASTFDGAGGGGGGTGAVTRMVLPAFMVPDMLYVQPGNGGLGSTGSGVNGSAGGISYVSMGAYPAGTVANLTVDENLFLMSNAAGAGGGAAGSATTAGAAGVAGTISVITSQNRGGYIANWFSNVGKIGALGGAIADGAGAPAVALGDFIPLSGGAGGSGSTGANVAGGAIGGAGIIQTIPGGSTTLPNGNGGFTWAGPFSNMQLMSTGGSGGASIDAGPAGHGGVGGFPGSGGGGGGAGATGGGGGKGGDGTVIFICL